MFLPHLHIFKCKHINLNLYSQAKALFKKAVYLREGEPTARSFVVFIGALELEVLPADPPQHSSQLLLQLQFPAERENQVVKSTRTAAHRADQQYYVKWIGLELLQKWEWAGVFTTELWLCRFESQLSACSRV